MRARKQPKYLPVAARTAIKQKTKRAVSLSLRKKATIFSAEIKLAALRKQLSAKKAILSRLLRGSLDGELFDKTTLEISNLEVAAQKAGQQLRGLKRKNN